MICGQLAAARALEALQVDDDADLRVDVETLAGEKRGTLLGLDVARDGALRLESGPIALRDVLSISFQRPIDRERSIRMTLWDGSVLWGDVGPESDGDNLSFNGWLMPKGIPVPIDWVRSLAHQPPPSSREKTAPIPDVTATEQDILITSDGTRLVGIVETITSSGIVFNDEKLNVLPKFPWSKVRLLAIAPLDEVPRVAADAVSVIVEGRDGSRLHGGLESFDPAAGILTLASPLLGSLTVEIRRVRSLQLRLGRVAYLSDRDPVMVTESCPYISEDVFRTHFTWQRDRCVKELRPLRIGEREFARGLGVHSDSKLEFDIEPGDVQFQAWIGVDATGRPLDEQSDAGQVVFRVLVDGQELFHSGNVSWRDPPKRVQVPVTGAKRIALIVEMGDGLHILDRADWADARMLRE